jgi:hypothetical protein
MTFGNVSKEGISENSLLVSKTDSCTMLDEMTLQDLIDKKITKFTQ